MTPMKAIRAKCMDCCCGQTQEVRLCQAQDRPLYPFRFGKNPNRAGLTNGGSFEKKHGSTSDSRVEITAGGNFTTGNPNAPKVPSSRTISEMEA